ncbi:DnaB-like helicase N-terminal domain-containing protein [Actinophytocola sp.]|uniref:DnaB-like helicase N-terminal domain-containing protein n=1 Tax=Actinophytocola sp. TaxID=1872138 RepID=UPI003899D3C9
MEGSISGSLDTDLGPRVGLYRANPHLLTEHALLGSLIHAPDGLNDMAKFLVGDEFSSRELGAVYLTVRGLVQARELTEVSTLTDRTEQRWACAGNRMRVLDALVNQRFTRTKLADPEGLILQLADAAPAETVPYRGVYDPSAQMRMARDVLADAIRRKVTDMGVRMQRRPPIMRPLRTAARQELTAVSLHSTLLSTQANLDRMTERWAQAVDRAGTNVGAQAATDVAAAAATARQPARPGPIAAFRLRRAERHLIHLALHTGHHLDGDVKPEFFSAPEHRNTWQLLMQLRERGEPVNRVSLYNETLRNPDIGPVMSHEDTFNKMRVAPETRPHRIANSLRTVVNAALTRAAKDAGAAVTTAATNRAVPIEGLLDYADQRVHALMGRATTASATHQKIAEHHEPGWSHTR